MFPPLDALQCPRCAGSLARKSDSSIVCTACTTAFPVHGEVPVFTSSSPEVAAPFNYREHYAVDNDKYDYFQERGAATWHEEYRLRQMIAGRVPEHASSILDVGCGGAWVAATFLPAGLVVWSLDITPVNPRQALVRHPSDRHFGIAADALSLPLRDGSFDCIVAAEIIEHVPYPKSFVESLMRVLAPGGKLIVTTPYRERIRETLCIHCNRLTPLDAHLHSFDEHILTGLYEKDDLESVSWMTFSNKALTVLRTHVITRHLPHRLWRMLDTAANQAVNKPHRILVEYVKAA
ncbi:MAG: methyltransferase domain-containing protein [Bacteroidota bacterium]